MSQRDLESAQRIIEENPSRARFVGPRDAGEAPVLVWMPGVPPEDAGPPEKVADSFGSFLLDRVQRALTD
jgi:hypothetical protein